MIRLLREVALLTREREREFARVRGATPRKPSHTSVSHNAPKEVNVSGKNEKRNVHGNCIYS